MPGALFVIEGTDGAGKGTQFELLKTRLEQAGYDIATFDFPQYDQPSSYFVKEYLNGQYGDLGQVGPYTGSLFYALDRYSAAPAIRQALADGKVVLANRYTASNMAHQGTKFDHAEERRGYFIWLDNLEFQMLGIPRPTTSFVLRVPADIARMMIDKKAARDYTDKKRDIHESDTEHLARAVEVYDNLCDLFPKDFQRIDCVRGGNVMTRQQVHDLLWERIEPMLPEKPAKTAIGKPQPVKMDNPYVQKVGDSLTITEEGQAFLKQAVTSNQGNVYAFTDKLSPTTIAAAMARLSRRGDDMRLTILDEFAHTMKQDEKLLQRVITAYGDDSVQQLVGMSLIVENTTKLMTNKLEWGRLAAYLEQSTRYIYFDQKDANGRYKYHMPSVFDQKTKKAFKQSIDHIFANYSTIVRRLTEYIQEQSDTPVAERDAAWRGAVRAQACDAARSVLPTATSTTVGIFASGQAVESLVMHLLSDELPEARIMGQRILDEARKIIPTFLERADKPDRGGAVMAYRANTAQAVKQLANTLLPPDYGGGTQDPVTLTAVWPKNELDIVPDMLYEHSSLSLRQLEETIGAWPYARKAEVFDAYIGERLNRRHKPGRALEKIHYSWDIVCDFGSFCDLQRHRMVDDLGWQQLTPRYGYDVPVLVEEAGLADLFEDCFDISLRLYSLLQERGYGLEAQYATLLGHRMRWKVTYNAREAFHLHELRTSPQGHPAYRKLVLQMHEKVAERHPKLADAMKFVNTGEDETLSRLAAERYSQYKMQQLDSLVDKPAS